jgi:hypothetical protein
MLVSMVAFLNEHTFHICTNALAVIVGVHIPLVGSPWPYHMTSSPGLRDVSFIYYLVNKRKMCVVYIIEIETRVARVVVSVPAVPELVYEPRYT